MSVPRVMQGAVLLARILLARILLARILLAVLLSAVLVAGCAGAESALRVEVEGVQTFEVTSRDHVEGNVDYPQDPPVGGPHNRVWQNCGFYDEPVPKEIAVHSMEHGAAWITYAPDLPEDQVATLQTLAQQPYVLVTPYQDLPAPVVASAWETQLQVATAGDPQLQAFVDEFANGPQTPEPGAPCDRGVGDPQ